MKKEIKAAWVKALRSGDYVQGTGTLAHEGKHCCLGVLAQVLADQFPETYAESGCKLIWDRAYMGVTIPGSGENCRTGGLVRALCNVIEMEYTAQDGLASRNDSGDSFEVIAQVIEANL
jgi:hypothetical protein